MLPGHKSGDKKKSQAQSVRDRFLILQFSMYANREV